DVMFVATSNTLNIPPALRDRMEIIRLSGYTEDEKLNIARQHLIPKQMENNGVREGELVIEEDAIRDIVRYYTREAGVRSLEREIGKICRKVVHRALLDDEKAKAKAESEDKDQTDSAEATESAENTEKRFSVTVTRDNLRSEEHTSELQS